jgi:nicotinamide riboside transporter PnuC
MPWYQFVDFAATVWAFIWTADFAGLVCGVAGTLLLAMNGRRAGWGFVAFLASNLGWVVFALEHGHTKLLAQHLIFAVSSSVGVWMWLVRPRAARFSSVYRATRLYRGVFASARLAYRCSR